MKDIVLAGGCFWGVEAYFKRVLGVIETKVGYAQGISNNPDYKSVCTGETKHAEVCYVKYDQDKISLEKILDHFWRVIDPTSLNKQGGDTGTQYRTGIYYIDSKDLDTIRKSLGEEQKKFDKDIVTEIAPLDKFYDAEDYHQEYLEKNPNGYCHINFDALLKLEEMQKPIRNKKD